MALDSRTIRSMSKMGLATPIVLKNFQCPLCDCVHEEMNVRSLTKPVGDLTHWGACTTNQEPVLFSDQQIAEHHIEVDATAWLDPAKDAFKIRFSARKVDAQGRICEKRGFILTMANNLLTAMELVSEGSMYPEVDLDGWLVGKILEKEG